MNEQQALLRTSLIPQLKRLTATLWGPFPGGSWHSWIDMDLTMAQFKLLLLVAEHDGLRVGDLAQTLGVTPPTVTASLDRLVAHGLVLRQDDPIDRRLVIARATPEGRALLGRLHVLTHREVLDCLQEMTESELENLFIGMAALHRVWSNRQNGFDHDDRKAPSLGPA